MKPAPSSIFASTGEDEEARNTVDNFLNETEEFVKYYLDREEPNFFERKIGELAFFDSLHRKGDKFYSQVTDNGVTYLTYEGSVLAGVLETRTEFNHIQFTFFRDLSWIHTLKKTRPY